MSIPKVIYQSWKNKVLNDSMKNATDIVKKLNPEYKYVLFDDEDCRKYILDNYGENYLNAFDSLIPGAFKCDFWRYAVLYKEGGIYLDIDMIPEKPFRDFVKDEDKFVSAVDRKLFYVIPCAIFQAFIAVEPGHPIMKYALELTFSNIVTRRKELFDALSISGPVVMGVAVNLFWKKKITHQDIKPGKYLDGIKLLKVDNDNIDILDLDNTLLIKNRYEGYDRGLTDYNKVEYYTDDPRKNKIYFIKGIFLLLLISLIICLIMLYICRRNKKNKN